MPRARRNTISPLDDILNRNVRMRVRTVRDAERTEHDAHMGRIKNVRADDLAEISLLSSTVGNLIEAREFPAEAFIGWSDELEQRLIAKLMGWYVDQVASGLYVIGRSKDANHYGVSGLAVQDYDQSGGEYRSLLQLDTRNSGQAFLDQMLGSTLRRSRLPAHGWQKFAMMEGANPSMTFSTGLALAANGGVVAVPILLRAPMLLDSVSIQSTDTATARKWAWYLYTQDVNDETSPLSVEWTVAASCEAPVEFTPAAASLRAIDAGNAPVFLGPGQYWLVIQNQHATNTLSIGTVAGGTNFGWNFLQNTLTNPLPLTALSFQAGKWTKSTQIVGVRLNGFLDHHYLMADVPMSGTDGSTTFTDNEGSVWTANGNAQIDTSLGSAYGLFDGAGDTLSTPDSPRWQLDDGIQSSKWRIEVDVRFNGDPGVAIVGFLQQRVDDSNFWAFRLQNNLIDFIVRSAGVTIVTATAAWNPATATTYNIAVIKDGTNGYSFFVDGVQVGTTVVNQTNVIPDFAASLVFGNYSFAGNNYFNGWARNLKIKKGTIV